MNQVNDTWATVAALHMARDKVSQATTYLRKTEVPPELWREVARAYQELQLEMKQFELLVTGVI